MATLVLTVVGGAIGGPVGAAIGGLLGQAVDREILKPKGRQGPRLTDLSVQTSRYGAQVPQLFGTMRVAGCVIWSTDLVERATRAGGKGRPSGTQYSYSVSFAVALSARPILEVRRIWADGTLIRGAAGDWKVATGFRLHRGGEAQAADPLVAAASGSGLAYRGLAYAVFEGLPLADYGNRIPSLTFEVVADDGPVRVGDVARAIGGGAIAGPGPDAPLMGFAAAGDSVRGVAEALAGLSGGWFAPAPGGTIRLETMGGEPAAVADDAAVMRRRRPVDTVPAALALSHYDPARDYQIGVQRARRGGAGWREEEVDAPAVLDAAAARTLAEARLRRLDRARSTLRVVTDAAALPLMPGDAVTLSADAAPWRVAATAIEGMRVVLDLAAFDAPAVAPADRPADAGAAVPSPDRRIGRTRILLAELPTRPGVPAGVPQVAVLAAGEGAGWRGAALLLSRDDGATWEEAGSTAVPATIGDLAAPLPRADPTLIDRANAVEVRLHHADMTLASVTVAAMGRGANLALVGDELLQFEQVVEVAPGRWRLTGLWRGRYAGPAMTHATGARFALIEATAAAWLPLDGLRVGERVRIAAYGVGDAEPATAALTVTGGWIAPPAPVHLRRRDGTLAWVRRVRAGGAWRDGVDVPLVEERERYFVAANGVETMTESAESALPAGASNVTVRQLGTFAASPAASITIGEGA